MIELHIGQSAATWLNYKPLFQTFAAFSSSSWNGESPSFADISTIYAHAKAYLVNPPLGPWTPSSSAFCYWGPAICQCLSLTLVCSSAVTWLIALRRFWCLCMLLKFQNFCKYFMPVYFHRCCQQKLMLLSKRSLSTVKNP